jgi:hypothetical protein
MSSGSNKIIEMTNIMIDTLFISTVVFGGIVGYNRFMLKMKDIGIPLITGSAFFLLSHIASMPNFIGSLIADYTSNRLSPIMETLGQDERFVQSLRKTKEKIRSYCRKEKVMR